MFLTLEDETEIVNAVVRPSLFERQRRVLMTASMMSIHGDPAQRGGGTISWPSDCSTFWPILPARVKGTACFRCLMSAAIRSKDRSIAF